MYQSHHYCLAIICYRRGYRFVSTSVADLFSCFQSKLDLKRSLIDTFATFLLLAYMKIGFAAFYVLAVTPVWSPDGSHTLIVYIDPSIAYFGSSHIGYAYSAFCVCSVDHSCHLAVPLPIPMVSQMS